MIEITTVIVVFGMGVAVGIYIHSQIDDYIDRNIKK